MVDHMTFGKGPSELNSGAACPKLAGKLLPLTKWHPPPSCSSCCSLRFRLSPFPFMLRFHPFNITLLSQNLQNSISQWMTCRLWDLLLLTYWAGVLMRALQMVAFSDTHGLLILGYTSPNRNCTFKFQYFLDILYNQPFIQKKSQNYKNLSMHACTVAPYSINQVQLLKMYTFNFCSGTRHIVTEQQASIGLQNVGLRQDWVLNLAH